MATSPSSPPARPSLPVLSSKTLPQPCIRPQTLAYCPTMDLVALAVLGEHVEVWRLNGEKVFAVACGVVGGGGGGGSLKGDGEGEGREVQVLRVVWRGDGRMLATATSDGIVRLIDVWSGRVAHKLTTSHPIPSPVSSSRGKISCLSWTANLVDANALKRRLDRTGPFASLDDFLNPSGRSGRSKRKVHPDLPKELGMLDIESSLPKLSTLPSTGGDDDIFSTRVSIDSIFHSNHNHGASHPPNSNRSGLESDMIDILLAGFDNGTIHLRIFDSFEIGNVDLSSAMTGSAKLKSSNLSVLSHACHQLLSSHLLVVESTPSPPPPPSSSSKTEGSLHLVSVDLNFLPPPTSSSVVSSASSTATPAHFLPILATKATQLQNLLRYLRQMHAQIAREIQVAFELPGRFLGNIKPTLAERRQEQHGSQGSSQNQEHADAGTIDGSADFEAALYHLVVTGECGVDFREWLVDELAERGVKRWEKAVGDCLDIVRRGVHECVLPALERVQVVVSRLVGLAMSSGGGALGLDERILRDVQGTVDCLNLLGNDLLRRVGDELKEFRGFMRWLKWVVEVETAERGSEREEELRESGAEGMDWVGVLKYVKSGMGREQLQTFIGTNATKAAETTAAERKWDELRYYDEYKKVRNAGASIPAMDELLIRMNKLCERVFNGIAERLRKSVVISYVGELPTTMKGHQLTMRITAQGESRQDLEAVLIGKDSRNPGSIIYTTIEVKSSGSGASRYVPKSSRTLSIPEGSEVHDVKFVDDESYLVLTSSKDGLRRLFSHPTAVSKEGENSWTLRHVFDDSRRPTRVEINGRKGRGVACVLEEGGYSYEVLDLEGGAEVHGEDEMDEDED